MVERVQCIDAGVDAPSRQALIGQVSFAGGNLVQRVVSAEPRLADAGRVTRARRALAMAEAVAWSGQCAKSLGEGLLGKGPVGEGPAGEGPADEKTEVSASQDKVIASQVEHAQVRRQRSTRRTRTGKQQRAQQYARDVKRFLARRDAGEPRHMVASAGDDEVARIDLGQECRQESGCLQSPRERRLGSQAAAPKVALGDGACDAALGGGLACGALHEIRGVFFGGDPPSPAMQSRETPGCETECSKGEWIVPFGCLLHIVRKAMRHPALAGRAIAWIGNALHPAQHMLRLLQHGCDFEIGGVDRGESSSESIFFDDELERRSIFVADVVDGLRGGDRLAAGHAGASAARKRARGANRTDDQARARLWCAELAIRLDAAGIIVMDGSGLDHLAWRRLQLAVSAAHDAALERCDGGGHAGACGPMVLIITPPDAAADGCRDTTRAGQCEGRGVDSSTRRLRTAATQWCVSTGTIADSWSAGSEVMQRERQPYFGFRWRMRLTHMRAGRGGQVDSCTVGDAHATASMGFDAACPVSSGLASPSDDGQYPVRDSASVHAAIANRSLSVAIEMPRTPCADHAWDALRARMREPGATRPIEARAIESVVESVVESVESGMRICLTKEKDAAELFALPAPRMCRAGWEVRSA
ncbi:MAG: hypothetical protein RLY21_1511 [Planctomycetota bacterium]